MKRLLLSIICIFVLFALTSCSASIMVDESGKTSLGLKKDKKHFYSEYNPTIIITDISEEDQQKILTAFDIIIPEQESSAHIISFIKEDCTDKFRKVFYYSVEFDGVEDYTNFYEANRHRKMSTGADDITFNEMIDEEQRYYLTFTYLYDEDIEDEFYPVYNPLFNELNEKYNS